MAVSFGSNELVLYLAWNMNIKSADMVYLQRTLDISSLPAIFTRQTFPSEFFTSKLLACVQFGIPLKPGVPAKAFEADSFKIIAFVVHGVSPERSCFFSKAEKKGKYAGYCKTLVRNSRVVDEDLVAFMKHLPRQDVLDLSCLQGVANFGLCASLAQLTMKHDEHRRDFIMRQNGGNNADLMECRHRHIEVRKTLARVGKSLEVSTFCTQPLQLGFSDYHEWQRGKDHCRSCSKKASLDDLLQYPCACGLMSSRNTRDRFAGFQYYFRASNQRKCLPTFSYSEYGRGRFWNDTREDRCI